MRSPRSYEGAMPSWKTMAVTAAIVAVVIIINENLDANGLPSLKSLVFTGGSAA